MVQYRIRSLKKIKTAYQKKKKKKEKKWVLEKP